MRNERRKMKVTKRSRKSEKTLTSCMDEMRETLGHLEPCDVCKRMSVTAETEQGLRRLTTTLTFTCSPSVSRHCRVSCASCWCFSGSWFSRCQWCRTSHRSAGSFYTSNWLHQACAIQSTEFFSSWCCSPILSCHRQLKLYPKFLHISHRENGSFEVLSLHLPSFTVDRCQL